MPGADLRDADLSGARLAGADLEGADLGGANLEGADVAGANLRRCRLAGCRLRGITGFRTAALQDADFEAATGLTGAEFAGADLSGARMPGALSFQGRLDYIAQTSQNARPAFLSILLSCVFIILTVFSTPDAALLSNASLAVLPDLATNIPAASFFWVAPILLVGLYVYLHLQMSGIGETLAELPAIFPDGTPLEKRAYPWVATNLLRMRAGWRGLRFEEVVAIFLLWGTVPLTLIAIWLRYLPLRDWWVSGLHVALIVSCAWGATRLFEQTASKCSGGAVGLSHLAGAIVVLAVILVAATLGVGLVPILADANPRKSTAVVLDLRDGDLSGTMLRRKDLRHAAAGKAKLPGADLRDADLRRADFQRSTFTGADLEGANLQRTDLDAAGFRDACLRKVTLQDADLEDADFTGAYLGLADLRTPLLTRANFAQANLNGADLRGAGLTGADFSGASLRCFSRQRKDPRADVTCANLEGAVLDGARFEGADLRYALGLRQEQLDAACGDAATTLPDGLSLPACAEPGAARQPRTDALENPCAHEMRDDRWPQ